MKPSAPRNIRKRRQDNSGTAPQPTTFLGPDEEIPAPPDNNVVETAKVKQALLRLASKETENPSSCIKLILGNSEAAHLTPELQDSLQSDYEISSISISEINPLNTDRIVTLYGDLLQVSRCAIHIAFLINAHVNNIVKHESFTLKSSNYNLSVLIETDYLGMNALLKKFPSNSIDYSEYERNLDLYLARLQGDFSSLFNSLSFIFSRHAYDKYASDDAIELIPFIPVHDGDQLGATGSKTMADNQKLLDFIYNKSALAKSQ